MEFQKSKTLLEKINALYKNISSDPRNISSIERDLMRSYILQFYESFLDMPTVAAAVTPPPPAAVEARPVEPKITLRKPETAPPPPPPKPEPPKVELPKLEPVPEPEPIPVPPPPPVVSKPIETPPPPPPMKEPEPEFVAPTPKPSLSFDPELEELFTVKSATELSEKLSQLPIGDIKKAMGLNERIYMQNELFGGDASLFEATVTTLNQLRSFEDAKEYLIRNVAGKYNWVTKDKKERAKEFIKLVKRRY